MNFEKETSEVSTSSNQPIVIMILIIALSGAAFYYFNQQLKQSISAMLNSSDISFEIPAEAKIDFEFLKSDEFVNLESFPEYASFQASEKIEEIKVGRDNPFIPFSGYAPQVENVQEVQENEEAQPAVVNQ